MTISKSDFNVRVLTQLFLLKQDFSVSLVLQSLCNQECSRKLSTLVVKEIWYLTSNTNCFNKPSREIHDVDQQCGSKTSSESIGEPMMFITIITCERSLKHFREFFINR